jgi:hypothetical protein
MISFELRHYHVRLLRSRRLRYRVLRSVMGAAAKIRIALAKVRLAIATVRTSATSISAYFGVAKASVVDRLAAAKQKNI